MHLLLSIALPPQLRLVRVFMECLEFVQLCSGQVGHSALEKVTYTLRVQWCLSKWYQFSGKHDGAIQALTMVSVTGL